MIKHFIPLTTDDLKFIKDILEREEDIKFKITECYKGKSMWILPEGDSPTELYLKSYIKDTFVFSRVFLKITRKGIFEKILTECKNYCKQYGFKKILIESILTPEMINFCEKHNFKPILSQCLEYEGKLYGDYQLIL